MTVDKIFERMNVLGTELHRVNLAVSRGGNSNVATPQESRPCSARPEMPVVQGQVVAGEVQAPQVSQLHQPHQPQQQFLGPDAMSNIQVFRCSIVIFLGERVNFNKLCFVVGSPPFDCPTFWGLGESLGGKPYHQQLESKSVPLLHPAAAWLEWVKESTAAW